jgi:hypothetical protein
VRRKSISGVRRRRANDDRVVDVMKERIKPTWPTRGNAYLTIDTVNEKNLRRR